jgi:hypothetical protein
MNDTMRAGYTYERVVPPGRGFAEAFEPELSPAEMLRLGVFGGKSMTDCRREFPKSWFRSAKLDARQIRRWKQIRRHIAQVRRHCEKGDLTCRKRQRQALLHWAYDSRKI